MAIHQDVETGGNISQDEITQPLIQPDKISAVQTHELSSDTSKGSLWVVLLSTFVAVCGSFEFGSCVGYSAPTQKGIRNDLGLSLSEVMFMALDSFNIDKNLGPINPSKVSPSGYYLFSVCPVTLGNVRRVNSFSDRVPRLYSVFGSILNIGAMIGAVTSGRIADLTGRKWAMRISAIVCIVAWFAIYSSQAAWSLDLGRFSMGYGIGIISYVVPVFIAEITPKNLRGGLTTVHQLMICSGVSVAFVVGVVVTWRTLALTGLVPCLILLLGLFFIPESPRWLAKVGREKEFKAALRRLRGKDADISKEAAEIQEYIETLEKLPKAGIQDLFQRRYALSVIVGVGLIAFQQFGGINGVAFYASEIFVSAGFSSGSVGTISIACIQVPITALGAILTDRTGRRPLLLIASTGTCLGNFLTGISFFLKDLGVLSGWAPMIALAGILIYIGSFSLGLGAVPWVIMSEIFPMNIKGIAGSLVTLMHWFGAWVVSYAFNFLMIWSSSGTFFLNAGVSAATVLFIAKLVPETKGRTLEEIQASMNS